MYIGSYMFCISSAKLKKQPDNKEVDYVWGKRNGIL